MAKDRCRYHPDKASTGTCLQCGVPICDTCKITRDEGIFCSDVCLNNFVHFQARLASDGAAGGRGSLLRSLKFWIILGVVFLAVVLFLNYRYNLHSIGNLPSVIASIWSDLLSLF